MANLLDWFKKRTEDVFGGIGNAINQAIGATGNQAQGVANNIRNVVATQPRNIQQASQNVFRGINDQYNRTALAQTPDILADTLKNIQEITRPLNDMGKDMVAKQYGIDRNQLEQIIKQPLGDRAKFAVNRPLELNKQNPMMGIMGSPLNPTNAAFNAYNNSPVPIPKVDTTDLVNDASDLYVKSGLADPVTGWIGENIVKPTAMNVARYADVTQGQQKYSEGLKGLAEGGTDAFGIASLLYTPAKAGQLALGGKAALRVAPSAALRGAGAGAGISTLNQYADTGRINPTDVALSGLLGGVANVALPVAGGYAGRGLQRAGTAVKPVARELRLDTGGFAKLPGKNNPIDPLEALKAEARKYKSAEEFVKAQGEPVYHRSPNKFSEFDISKVSNDTNRQRGGWGLYFSDAVDAIPEDAYGKYLYEVQAPKGTLLDTKNPVDEKIVSKIVDAVRVNGKNPSELSEFSYNGYLFYKTLSRILGGDKEASLFLSKNGIDGLKRTISPTANDYILFNDKSIKTKQQLTDLYNQATKGKDIDPLLNEARKYKSADEFWDWFVFKKKDPVVDGKSVGKDFAELNPLVSNRKTSDFLGFGEYKFNEGVLKGKIGAGEKLTDGKVNHWKERISKGERPVIIVEDKPYVSKITDHLQGGREYDAILEARVRQGHSRLEAYKQLGIKEVPVVYKSQLTDLYNQATAPQVGKTDYRSTHQIDTATAKNIGNLQNVDDIVTQVKSKYGLTNYDQKDIANLKKIIGNPEADVKIYRASPVNEINSGDWVTTSKTYANDIKRQNGGKVYEYTVKAKELNLPANIEDNPSLARFSAFQYSKADTPRVAQVGKTTQADHWTTPLPDNGPTPIPKKLDSNGVQIKAGDKIEFYGASPDGKKGTTTIRWQGPYKANASGKEFPGQWLGNGTLDNNIPFKIIERDGKPFSPPAQVGKTGGNLPPKTPPTKPGTPELPNVPKKSPKTTEVKLNTDRLDLSKTQKARVDKNTAATVKRMSNAEVEKLAKSAGIDTKQKGFNETRKEIAEQLNTRRKAVQLEKQADRARRSGDTEKAKALLKKAATLEKTSRTQGTAAGRNLQARKIIANELNSPQQKVFKLLDEAGVDVDKYVDRFADVDFSNSTEVAKAYRELVPATAEEWLDKYRYTNMLSSPLTHLVNVSSNLTGTLGVSPIRKIYEGGVDATRNAVTRTGRTRYAGEGAVQFKESLKNIPAAVKEFKDVWTGKVDMTNPDFENTAITSRLAVGGKKGAIDSVLSFIPRLLEASDRFSMNMTEAGELGSLKYRQGKGIKVTDMAGKAKENATYTAFRQELNKNGQGHILGAIDWVPTILKQGREAKNPIIRNASKIAFPFVNTPTNLFKQGIEYSPLGVTTLWGNSNKTAQSAKMLMGTTATALIGGTLAANDALTFAEPSNAKERDAFRAEGKQAYSFKIGDKWISYSKMHPAIAFNFAITAAVKDAMDKGTIDQSASDKIMSAAGGMMGYLTDQSYMKNIGDLVSVFQSKDGSSIGDSISSEGMNTINQLVPFRSMVSWIGRQIDPTQRKVDYSANVMEQIYQGIVKDIPGLNSGVPTRKNPYTGQDIKSDFPLLNSWNPYRVTQDMGYGNTTGMNVEQRQMQKGLPETERAGFRAGVMQQKGLERLADKEKEQLKSAEGQTKTLSNGKVYAKVGDKYETFDSQEKADVAIFKDEFKKSDKKSAVKGDTYFYKKKNGDVVTKPKALYDWEQTDARANLEMDRAYEAKDIDTWAKAAQTKLDGLEKKKSLYDPETEQDEIDKITLQQENLLQKAAKYLSKGMGGSGGSGSRGGSRGGSGGSGGSGSFITTGFKTAAQLKAPKIKGISVRKPTYKASTKKLSVSKMPKVTGVRLT